MNADLVQVSLPAREGCGQQSQTGQMQNSTQLKGCFDVIYGSIEEDRSAHYFEVDHLQIVIIRPSLERETSGVAE